MEDVVSYNPMQRHAAKFLRTILDHARIWSNRLTIPFLGGARDTFRIFDRMLTKKIVK